MPLTVGQSTSFFTASTQMGLPPDQRTALAAQGLTTPDDFSDFGIDEHDTALKNMRTAIPGLPAVAEVLNGAGDVQVAAAPAVPPVPPVVMPAKSTQQLEVTSTAWHYYNNTGQTVTNTNMHYKNVLKDFHIEWKTIESMAKESKPDVPVITKGNINLKWTDTFKDYCLNTFSVRKTPLAYVI